MIYISSSASSKDKIKDAVLELVQLGFLNIELSGGTKYYQGIENDLLSLKEKYKINFLIHNYFPPPKEHFVMNISSKDASLRNNTFELISSAIRLAKRLGSDLYTLHPGFNKSYVSEKDGRFYDELNFEEPREKQNTKEDFYEAIDFLLNKIIKKDIRIGIENSFPINKNLYSFLDSGEDIREFLDCYIKEPNIGLLLDLGHLNIASNYLGFDKFDTIKKIFTGYLNKVFGIHVSENDGSYDLHQVSHPDSWQIELVRQNKKVLDSIPIIFEWRRICNSQTYCYFAARKRILEK